MDLVPVNQELLNLTTKAPPTHIPPTLPTLPTPCRSVAAVMDTPGRGAHVIGLARMQGKMGPAHSALPSAELFLAPPPIILVIGGPPLTHPRWISPTTCLLQSLDLSF